MESRDGYTIKDIAEKLGITMQAIYKQKDILLEKGYLYKDEIERVNKISEEGYQFLAERKEKNKKYTSESQIEVLPTLSNDEIIINDETIQVVINTLTTEIKRLQQENSLKTEIIKEKDYEIKKLNEGILGITNKTLQLEEGRNVEKRGFFAKLFNKNTKH